MATAFTVKFYMYPIALGFSARFLFYRVRPP